MELEILLQDRAWAQLDLPALSSQALSAMCMELGLDAQSLSVSLLAGSDARIAELNAEFRGKPTPTNVLSWPSEDRAPATPGGMPPLPSEGEIGDIALAFDTCKAEAEAAGKPFDHHISHLVVHGALHCLGFDHETEADADQMETLETRILARLGVPDPY